MAKYVCWLTLALLAAGPACSGGPSGQPQQQRVVLHSPELEDLAARESLIPVRPGEPGVSPFWNVNSTRFIHAPAFGFPEVEGAVAYRFTLACEADGASRVFEAAMPWATLEPVWAEVPVGYVDLAVDGLDSSGNVLGRAGERTFYRASHFRGPYHRPVAEYRASARRALACLFGNSCIGNWLTGGTPDRTYSLYCYPSKMIAAVIRGMILYSELAPEHAETSLKAAENAARYLIRVSEPEGSPLEYFPPTYDAGHIDPALMSDEDSNWEYAYDVARKYDGQIMLTYPSVVAGACLDLFDTTGDPVFREAAVRIADTYAAIQLPDGHWWLKMYTRSGEPVVENLADPAGIIALLRRLKEDYGLDEYSHAVRKAEGTVRGKFDQFNFEGQFEDVEPSRLYENLSHAPARRAAVWFLDRLDQDPANLARAEEYLRFAEDQFVVWENPIPRPNLEEEWTWTSDRWVTPCALEQYECYTAVDASAAGFIETFYRAYEATGREIYLAKALSLANSMTVAQNPETGMYPTWWANRDDPGWINCAIYDAIVMAELADNLEGLEIVFRE